MKMSKVCVAVLLSCFAMGAGAQTGQSGAGQGGSGGQGGPGGGKHRGPPPQALAACEGKTMGADCSFTGMKNNTLTGTCFAPKPTAEGKLPLACRPVRDGQGTGQSDQGSTNAAQGSSTNQGMTGAQSGQSAGRGQGGSGAGMMPSTRR